jgi:hypothetical protein
MPLAIAFVPAAAQAHVKWFCAFDVAGSPAALVNVLCQDFEQLVALAIVMLVLGGVIEGSPLGAALLRALDRTTSLLRRHTEIVVRIVAGGFFMSLWAMGNVLLTPELTTKLEFVPWLQLAMAAAMLSRRTLPLAALGIVALFSVAAAQYGMFHLMDYPVFLGLAGYLACIGLRRSPFGMRPLDLLRWSAAVTLMWASIEKWAYPQWTFPVFVTHPGMSFGIDIAYYMRAAGVVEFTLAFALLGTPLVRRCAAIILAATFIAAIGEFGMIDAIGHSCIIAVLLAILADDARVPFRRRAVFMTPVGYSASLAAFLVAYYGLHTALFGTTLG